RLPRRRPVVRRLHADDRHRGARAAPAGQDDRLRVLARSQPLTAPQRARVRRKTFRAYRSIPRVGLLRTFQGAVAILGLAVTAAAASLTAAAGAPADPLQTQQWALSLVGAPAAWARAEGDGVMIAVVDSGIDTSHPDLRGAVAGGTACFGTGGDPGRCSGGFADDDGHGTHVAGLAAAREGDGVGVAGVAPM